MRLDTVCWHDWCVAASLYLPIRAKRGYAAGQVCVSAVDKSNRAADTRQIILVSTTTANGNKYSSRAHWACG